MWVSARGGDRLGFIEILQVASSFGSMFRTASAVRQPRRFGTVIGHEQAAFRRYRLCVESSFGQSISAL
jgi:hypothetical protein